MIAINLLGEKPDKRGVYAVQLLSFGACVLITFGVCFFMLAELSSTVEAKRSDKELFEGRLAKLRIKTKKVEELETKRKLLKDKLTTIARIKANKQGPVRVLDDINLSLPERAWLDSITEKDGFVELKGVAIDNQTISQLMFDLEKSKYFQDVKLAFSEMILKDDVKLKQFALSAKLESLLPVQPEEEKVKADGEDSDKKKAKGRKKKGKAVDSEA